MKAIVLHEFGGPDHLKYEDVPDPTAGPGQVLIRVAATSVNPIDFKIRSGSVQKRMPVQLPEILGRDVSGIVRAVGEGVTDFTPGDHVFALTNHAYAELCVVDSKDLARVPEGLDLVNSAALPLVCATGEQLAREAAGVKSGETVLVAGAVGSVGRVAVFTAKKLGAKVIAGVRKSQLDEVRALKADAVVALDDKSAMEKLGFMDAVADAVGGETGQMLLGKVKPGGTFGTVVAVPENAAQHPTVHATRMMAHPDPARLVELARAVGDGSLVIPIDRMVPLAEAAEAQAAAEKGGVGKILLLA